MARARRVGEATAFVAVWIAVGCALPEDPNLYLVTGVPLTIVFQLFVRKRRLEELWVRDGPPIGRLWFVVASTVAGVALIAAIPMGVEKGSGLLWTAALLFGCGLAVYATRHANRQTIREGLRCLAIGGSIGIVMITLTAITDEISDRAVSERIGIAVGSLLAYFAVSFVLEEVAFRGAIDSHVHHPDEPKGLMSAAFVSALWGLWHLPLADGSIISNSLVLLAVHVPIGLVLSLFWRRSGNLAVPAATHAFINAVRNAML